MIAFAGKTFSNPLFVFAMDVEAGQEFADLNVVFTGLGKVNAAYQLMKSLTHHSPDLVINLGTAGSTFFDCGDLVCCTQFVQRDMDVSPLGYNQFQTPFEATPIILKNGIRSDRFKEGICGSGDNFEVKHRTDAYNVIDMEAYALAKVSLLENIPFLCLKYITDGANDDAAADWNESVKKASLELRRAVDSLFNKF